MAGLPREQAAAPPQLRSLVSLRRGSARCGGWGGGIRAEVWGIRAEGAGPGAACGRYPDARARSATPSPEEVRSWAQSFDKLMHSPAGRSVFREFLRTEYSEENMLFWLACEELKAEANQHVVDEKARLIYEDYVSILSPKEVRRAGTGVGGGGASGPLTTAPVPQVSLDSRVREGVNKKMQEPSAHTFDDAQLQIYTLMHRDSYPRFLSSPAYRALLLRGRSTSSSEA